MLKVHVAIAYFKCFKCFRGTFQVLYIDVAKVDCDVAHVVMAIYIVYVQNVSSIRNEFCKCFV
jgi:hypothetical protein